MATPTQYSSTIGSETPRGRRISGRLLHTQIIATSPDGTDDSAHEQAAATIRAGRVVAFPSSNGYVLAADPLNLNAIAAVFRAKGRQLNRALPILVDSTTTVEDYTTREWTLIKAGIVTADQIAACLNGVSPDPLDD